MKKISYFFFLTLGFLSFQLNAQQSILGCGTEDQHLLLERLENNRIEAALRGPIEQRGVTRYVPVKIHQVLQDDGSGGNSKSDLLDMMCILNDEFDEIDIQFYITGEIEEIRNTRLFEDPRSSTGRIVMRSNKAANAINVFIVGDISTNQPDARTQAYYTSGIDVVVSDKNDVKLVNVIPHEMGHFFSLAHPFYGWEGHGYDEEEHGNPVRIHAPSDRSFLGAVDSILNEKVDKSNCTQAADRICDTPPDYLFAFSGLHTGGCNEFRAEVKDPDGTVVDPMEVNLMSYFNSCFDYELTEGQGTAILNDYNSSGRAYIRSNYVPSLLPIEGKPEILSPAGGTTPGYNEVSFRWSSVKNAEYYLLEIDRFSTFNFSTVDYIVSDTTFLSTDLAPGVAYFWRVRPYGQYVTCTEASDAIRFRTGNDVVATNEIAAVDSWMIQPNPLRSDQQFSLQLEASEAFSAEINVLSATGQQIRSFGERRFVAGNNSIDLSTDQLAAGVYFVNLRSEQGIATRRLVVMR